MRLMDIVDGVTLWHVNPELFEGNEPEDSWEEHLRNAIFDDVRALRDLDFQVMARRYSRLRKKLPEVDGEWYYGVLSSPNDKYYDPETDQSPLSIIKGNVLYLVEEKIFRRADRLKAKIAKKQRKEGLNVQNS